jgi:3-vinyl bacteriochlorophyllide hydratase
LNRIINRESLNVQCSERQVELTYGIRPSRFLLVKAPIYTPEQKVRRDATVWTLVQGILAPIQFLVFIVSLILVLRYMATGSGFGLAAFSVVVKTLLLYAIMITGCIWEKRVFGMYLFAPAFFWEDMVSMVVMILHTVYLVAWFTDALPAQTMMMLALVAYATYLANALQFVLKLRAARLSGANGGEPAVCESLAASSNASLQGMAR